MRFPESVLRDEEEELGGGGGASADESPNEQTQAGASDKRLEELEKHLEQQSKVLAGFAQNFGQQRQPQQQQPQGDPREAFAKGFYEDPIRGTAQMAQQAAAMEAQRLRAEMHPMQVETARNSAKSKNPEIFDKYNKEIQEWVQGNYEPQHWSNPMTWELGMKSVMADRLDEISTWKAERKKAAQSINAPSRRGFTPEGEQKGLTDDEKQMADFLGMTEDDYETAKKNWKLDQQAPTTGRKMLDSDWANIITLDSRKKPKRKKAAA